MPRPLRGINNACDPFFCQSIYLCVRCGAPSSKRCILGLCYGYRTLGNPNRKSNPCTGLKGKGKVFPYSLPSVGPGVDPGVQAVSPQVT